jgi:hypothetical protein
MKKLSKGRFLVPGLGALFLMLMFGACHCSDRLQVFVPGTYVNAVKGEFSVAEDTLVIVQVRGDNYDITRRTGFRSVRNGVLLPKHFQVRKLEGIYDVQAQVLRDVTNSRVLVFDADKGGLKVHGAVYRKL